MKSYSITTVLAFIVSSLIAAQCGASAPSSSTPDIKVVEPYARASTENGVIYLELVNAGGSNDTLVSAETNAAESAELHKTTMDDNGVMRMSPVSGFEIPAGGSVTLEPGGKHIMLIGVQQGLASGDEIELMLNFEQSGSMTLMVEVQEGPTGHDDEDHIHGEHAEDMFEEMEHDMEHEEDPEN